jgi:hypothetical protein
MAGSRCGCPVYPICRHGARWPEAGRRRQTGKVAGKSLLYNDLAACHWGSVGVARSLSGSTLVLSDKLEQDRDNFRLRTPCLTR